MISTQADRASTRRRPSAGLRGTVSTSCRSAGAACIFELMVVWNCRSVRHNAFKVGFFTNRYLLIFCIIGGLLTISLCYVPFLQVMFNTVPLGIYDWLWIFFSAGLGFLVLPEIFIRRRDGFQVRGA